MGNKALSATAHLIGNQGQTKRRSRRETYGLELENERGCPQNFRRRRSGPPPKSDRAQERVFPVRFLPVFAKAPRADRQVTVNFAVAWGVKFLRQGAGGPGRRENG